MNYWIYITLENSEFCPTIHEKEAQILTITLVTFLENWPKRAQKFVFSHNHSSISPAVDSLITFSTALIFDWKTPKEALSCLSEGRPLASCNALALHRGPEERSAFLLPQAAIHGHFLPVSWPLRVFRTHLQSDWWRVDRRGQGQPPCLHCPNVLRVACC